MFSQKQSHHHVEEDPEKDSPIVHDPVRADKEIYHDDGTILVDLGATKRGDETVTLKTAKDGHVSESMIPTGSSHR